MAKMPPILLKAGSCSPYFSSSRFMLLISSSGAEHRGSTAQHQPCGPVLEQGQPAEPPLPCQTKRGAENLHTGMSIPEAALAKLIQNLHSPHPSCHGTPEHWWQTPLAAPSPGLPAWCHTCEVHFPIQVLDQRSQPQLEEVQAEIQTHTVTSPASPSRRFCVT